MRSVTSDQQSSHINIIYPHIFSANMRNQCYLSTKRRLQKDLLCLAADYKQNFENETIVNRTMDYDETKDQQNFERLPLGMN